MRILKLSIVFIITLTFFTSCVFDFGSGKRGNGNVTTEERNVSEDFSQVEGSRGLEIILIKGEINKIEVESDENLQKHIETTISNGRLKITTDENLSGSATKKVYVTFIELSTIEASSGAEISVRGQVKNEILTLEASSGGEIEADVFAKEINLKASSGGAISVTGKATQLIAKASSGGDIEAKDLNVSTANAEASSGGEITINVLDRLNSKASSGGEINYYGNPKEMTSNNSNSGNVKKM